jgi:hypothetical protein
MTNTEKTAVVEERLEAIIEEMSNLIHRFHALQSETVDLANVLAFNTDEMKRAA